MLSRGSGFPQATSAPRQAAVVAGPESLVTPPGMRIAHRLLGMPCGATLFALPTWQGWLGMRFGHRPVLGVYVASQPAHARLGIGEGVPTDGCSLAMPRVTPTSSLCICARQWIGQS